MQTFTGGTQMPPYGEMGTGLLGEMPTGFGEMGAPPYFGVIEHPGFGEIPIGPCLGQGSMPG